MNYKTTKKDKNDIIKAYFDFGKILNKKDSSLFTEYAKKAHPEFKDKLQKDYKKYADSKGFGKIMDEIILSKGYNTITPKMFLAPNSSWIKNKNDVLVLMKEKGSSVARALTFRKNGKYWYLKFLTD
jgi:hypothetical protein